MIHSLVNIFLNQKKENYQLCTQRLRCNNSSRPLARYTSTALVCVTPRSAPSGQDNVSTAPPRIYIMRITLYAVFVFWKFVKESPVSTRSPSYSSNKHKGKFDILIQLSEVRSSQHLARS